MPAVGLPASLHAHASAVGADAIPASLTTVPPSSILPMALSRPRVSCRDPIAVSTRCLLTPTHLGLPPPPPRLLDVAAAAMEGDGSCGVALDGDAATAAPYATAVVTSPAADDVARGTWLPPLTVDVEGPGGGAAACTSLWTSLRSAAVAAQDDTVGESTPLLPGGRDSRALNVVSRLAHLRGAACLAQRATQLGKEWLLTAVALDSRNVAALQQLLDNHLLSAAEDAALDAWLAAGPSVPEAAGWMSTAATGTMTASPAVSESPAPHWLVMAQRMRFRRFEMRTQAATPPDPRRPAPASLIHLPPPLRNEADTAFAQAEGLACQHDPAASFALTRRLVAADPLHTRVLQQHIANLIALRRGAELHPIALAATQGQPNAALSWLAVGGYYLASGKPAAAVKPLQRAATLDPQHAPSWLALGGAFSALNELEPALQAFRTAATLWPASHIPHLSMASVAARGGQPRLARLYLDAACTRCGTDPAVYHETGLWHLNAGETDIAWPLLTLARQLTLGLPQHARAAWEPTLIAAATAARKLG